MKYHDDKAQFYGKKIALMSLDNQKDDPIYRIYVDKIRQKLENLGFHLIDDNQADYGIKFDYGSEKTYKLRKVNPLPFPSGFPQTSLQAPIPQRFLIVNIIDLSNSKLIFEGATITDDGYGSTVNEKINIMINAIFKDFPGENGKIKNRLRISQEALK